MRLAVTLVVLMLSNEARAGLIASTINYLKQYRLGVELSSYDSKMQLDYEVNSADATHDSCSAKGRDDGTSVCRAIIGDDSNRGMDYGIFLQQRFDRKGLLHYDFDLGFSFRYLSGNNEQARNAGEFDHPFSEVSYQYFFGEIRPYIQFGLTPKGVLPDLIVSMGPVAHYSFGATEIDGKKFQTDGAGVLSRSGVMEFMNFFEIELVFMRFGRDGALSLFTSNVKNHPTVGTGALLPEKAGDSDIVGGEFFRNTSGIKWVIGKL